MGLIEAQAIAMAAAVSHGTGNSVLTFGMGLPMCEHYGDSNLNFGRNHVNRGT